MRVIIYLLLLFTVFVSFHSLSQNEEEKYSASFAINLMKNHQKKITLNTAVFSIFDKIKEENFTTRSEYQNFLQAIAASINPGEDKIKASKLYYLLGIRYNDMDDLIPAYELYQKSESLLENQQLYRLSFSADLLSRLGLINLSFSYFDIGKEYYFKSLKCNNQSKTSRINTLNSIGLTFVNQNIDSAFFYYSKALSLTREIGSKIWEPIILGNLGFIYLQKKDTLKAIENYKKDKIFSYQNDELESSFLATSELVKIYYLQKNSEEMKRNLDFCNQLRLKMNTNMYHKMYHSLNIKYFDLIHDYPSAYLEYKKMHAFENPNRNKLKLDEYKQKLLQSNLQRSKIEKRLLIIRKQQYENQITLIILISFLTISLITFGSYQYNKRKKKDLELLTFKNIQIAENLQNNKTTLKNALFSLSEKNQLIDQLTFEISNINTLINSSEKEVLLDKLHSFRLTTDEDLIHYKRLFDKLYPGFTEQLSSQFTDITNAELRLATLIKLNYSNLEMANTLGISIDSVRKTNLRLRKRLNLDTPEELSAYINNIN